MANPNVHVELYLHQFMPSIVTCMVAKRLCASPDENHWALREQAAETMNFVCEKFGREYPTIQARSIHWSPYDRVGVVNAVP